MTTQRPEGVLPTTDVFVVPPPADLERDIRFAVVMYGGVSLAVYMGGIARELHGMVTATAAGTQGDLGASWGQGTGPIYRLLSWLLGDRDKRLPEVAEALRTARKNGDAGRVGKCVEGLPGEEDRRVRFLIDIISGTSAGGMNGVFLAKALANDAPLDPLDKMWLNVADLSTLLYDGVGGEYDLPAGQCPPSLLNGQFIYSKLLEALQEMTSSKHPRSLVPDTLDLFVTATDLHGCTLPLELSDGAVPEKKYRYVFNFRRDSGRNDFVGSRNPYLAFAARCTSAFPVAFAPMRVGDARRLLKNPRWVKYLPAVDKAPWLKLLAGDIGATRHYCCTDFYDGGVLDNKPFRYAVDAVASSWGSLPGERKLLYIEPDPDGVSSDPDRYDRPKPVGVALEAGSQAVQTIRDEVERFNQLNAEVRRAASRLNELGSALARQALSVQTGAQWMSSPGDPDPAEQVYLSLQASLLTDALAAKLAGNLGFGRASAEYSTCRYLLKAWRRVHIGDGAQTGDLGLRLDRLQQLLLDVNVDYRLRRLRFLRHHLDGFLRGGEVSAPRFRGVMGDLPPSAAAAVRQYLLRVRSLLGRQHDALVQTDRELTSPVDDPTRILGPRSTELLSILGSPDELQRERRARILLSDENTQLTAWLDDLRQRLRVVFTEQSDALRGELGIIEGERVAVEPPGEAVAVAQWMLQRLYTEYEHYDRVLLPLLQGTDAEGVDTAEIYRVSPRDARSLLDRYDFDPEDGVQLMGTRLGHFAAFFDDDWRRNDMLWGRLNGAERIITVLLPGDDEDTKYVREELIRDAYLEIVVAENSGTVPSMYREQEGALIAALDELANQPRRLPKDALAKLLTRLLGLIQRMEVPGPVKWLAGGMHWQRRHMALSVCGIAFLGVAALASFHGSFVGTSPGARLASGIAETISVLGLLCTGLVTAANGVLCGYLKRNNGL